MSLTLIRASLAAQAVVAGGGVTPQTFCGSTLPAAVETASLPCRLLLAGDDQGKGDDGNFIALGKLTQVTYQISDVLLWVATGQGIGRSGVEADLTTYTDNYLLMLRQWRNAGQSAANVTGFRSTIGVANYPLGGPTFYWAAPVVVQVEEYYAGA